METLVVGYEDYANKRFKCIVCGLVNNKTYEICDIVSCNACKTVFSIYLPTSAPLSSIRMIDSVCMLFNNIKLLPSLDQEVIKVIEENYGEIGE